MSRRQSWMIVREGDAEPEYFRGRLFGAAEAFTRTPALAYQFFSRRTAVNCLRDNFPADERDLRIVPTWTRTEE